jgi:uncharacterized tellurite resistance protein B-like protein
MLEKFKSYFVGNSVGAPLAFDKDGHVADESLQVATVVLLMEVAGADHSIAQEEANALCQIMEEEFELPEEIIPHLLEVAVAAKRQAGRINEFINDINEHFNDHQKERILTMVWRMVLADDRIDREEEKIVKQIQTRLKLADPVSDRARRTAESKKV